MKLSFYFLFILCLMAGVGNAPFSQSPISDTPPVVLNPQKLGYSPKAEAKWFALSLGQFLPAKTFTLDSAGRGLFLDLGDTTLYGRLHSGPFYFNPEKNDYPEGYFRVRNTIEKGKAFINLSDYFDPGKVINVNQWKNDGILAYRLELWRKMEGKVRYYGFHDSRVHFKRVNRSKNSEEITEQQTNPSGYYFKPVVSIIDGPMLGLVESTHPERVAIYFRTDRPSQAWVEVKQLGQFTDSQISEAHEIQISGLEANQTYQYRVIVAAEGDTTSTPFITFQSAPPPGKGQFLVGFCGDSRQSPGGGEREYLGVNRAVLSAIARQLFRKNIRLFLFGGDLVNGFTNSPDDFIIQLRAFKESIFGLAAQVPLYSSVGNHEALLHMFDDGSRYGLGMDRWPYEAMSVEAVFSREFVFPANAPAPYPGMPPYRETVYSFQFGSLKVIVLNTNYWWTSHTHIPELGGSPEGYILPNQMAWLEKELEEGEANPTVKYILVMTHEPPFPNGGHVKDGMWHHGNNQVRAYRVVHPGTKPKPFDYGIVEMRNHFWKLVSQNKKVAAVLTSDEHNYHRTLITNKTPVGVVEKDDLNGDGILNDNQYSPNPEFKFPTWSITSGGAGAPAYIQQPTPWSEWVKSFAAINHYLLFHVDDDKIRLEVFNTNGQLIDSVDNLMEIKHRLD